ncbi:uncharacterized protein LOC106738249 isoform X1 [Alligator mississippiensis]|uniref:uncharacterized protein LOC106738249 isoform X1 n=2 Tax=Alligator mississippiensis TaxID=8496 RepID=UPI0006EC6C38|nr:uncharacterized protein LOC106738249 isoform X1 [Alligator mississippiensis]
MKLMFELVLICGLMRISRFQCVHEKEYFCSSIPTDFPEGLTSVIFVVTKIGVLNSTVFNSPSLKSVTSLALANSGITKIEPGAFYAFQSLTKLSLYQNNLTTTMASWLSKPERLENLTLSQNIIQGIGPSMLSHFSNLTTLHLANNRINMIAVGSLKHLSKLTYIDLSGNNLSTLTRNVFIGLRPPRMKLGDNPWNCSCELQDFGFFLQELMNASLLEDASSVTCQSPAGMKGVSVWNISDFNCSPELPSPFLTSVFHKVGLPLVLMCLAFLSFLLLLLLLWVVKRDKKQVQPGREATVEDGDGEQKGPMNAMTKKIRNNRLYEEKVQTTESDQTPQRRMLKGRAKSASAVMLRKEFEQGTSQHWRPVVGNEEPLKPSCVETHEQTYVEGKDDAAELWYFNSLPDWNKRAMLSHEPNISPTNLHLETLREDSSDLLKPSPRECGVSEVPQDDESKGKATTETFEPLLYLSVARRTEEPASHAEPKGDGVTHANTGSFSLRRVFTWPYENGKMGQSQKFFNTLDSFKAQFCLPTSDPGIPAPVKKTETEDEQKRSDLHLKIVKEQQTLDLFSTGAPNLTREVQPVKALVHTPKKRSKQAAAIGNAFSSLSRKGLAAPKSIRKKWSNKKGSSQAGACNDRLTSPASLNPADCTGSPCDNTFLTSNKYSFIDLLHEVVENRGRWTRERWLQTHRAQNVSQPPMKPK